MISRTSIPSSGSEQVIEPDADLIVEEPIRPGIERDHSANLELTVVANLGTKSSRKVEFVNIVRQVTKDESPRRNRPNGVQIRVVVQFDKRCQSCKKVFRPNGHTVQPVTRLGVQLYQALIKEPPSIGQSARRESRIGSNCVAVGIDGKLNPALEKQPIGREEQGRKIRSQNHGIIPEADNLGSVGQ